MAESKKAERPHALQAFASHCLACVFSINAIGVLSLVLVVTFWVGSNFLTQRILEDYSKPFLMCYLTNLTYMIYFVFLLVEDPVMSLMRRRAQQDHLRRKTDALQRTASSSLSSSSSSSSAYSGDPGLGMPESTGEAAPTILPPISHLELAKIAFVFSALYLASNYATNVAFELISVNSVSILASTCGFFTLVFGWLVGVEALSVMRILAVAISVGGVVLLGIPELFMAGNRTLGNGLALTSAILYGVYSIFLKRIAIDESRISMPLLFAFGGLYTLLFAWPILLALHLSGFEVLELPQSPTVAWYIVVNVVLGGLIPNYLWNVAFVCTSPLVVAIGISFNIPLTLVVSHFLKGEAFFSYRLASGVCIVVGFVIVNLSNVYPQLDLACERLLVRLGIMHPDDVRTTEQRASKLRSQLVQHSDHRSPSPTRRT